MTERISLEGKVAVSDHVRPGSLPRVDRPTEMHAPIWRVPPASNSSRISILLLRPVSRPLAVIRLRNVRCLVAFGGKAVSDRICEYTS